MLYHFRYVLRAFLPFQKENMADVKKLGSLDGHGVSYLERAVSLLEKKGNDISNLVNKRKLPKIKC